MPTDIQYLQKRYLKVKETQTVSKRIKSIFLAMKLIRQMETLGLII